ncbi:hypothetical protein [Thioclava sp. GXIMD2076]|uniref:Cytochrome c domain-containing protein n=1 Tax=Thioclava kandeliae TaxID=3070818 RepID=A0ABV1SDT0_9RHOB
MRFSIVLAMCVIPFVGAAQEASLPVPSAAAKTFLDRLEVFGGHKGEVYAACCKTCHAGKACGNSCISRSKQCHKGAGCACDG